MAKPKIILASQSVQRQNLLKAAGVIFSSFATDSDEKSIRTRDLSLRAQQIAQLKAKTAQSTFPEAVIIAADTFVVLKNTVYEKPANLTEAKQMLRRFSGNTFSTYTGYAVVIPKTGKNYLGTIINTAQFRTLSEAEIDHYVKKNPVTTWAGGFSPAYDAGANLIEWIEGSLTSFTHGLPMEIIIPVLEKVTSEATQK
ncbi:MAG: Maf family nucleotide pyrophosphatase [Patescibacteria group bacterium]